MKSDDSEYKYLKLLKYPLDDDQSEVCFNTKNAVIAAGAGSGKTQVLATRFAWLVMSKKIDVSQILTLTFTDKAASEMYKRIYDTLSFFASYKKGQNPKASPEMEADLDEEKVALAKKALSSFSTSHIQTLDSYCGGIVRQCANRYGLTPAFSVGAVDIKSRALKFLLKHRDNIAIRTFVKPGELQKFAETVLASTINGKTSIATEKGWFEKKFNRQCEEILAFWNFLVTGNTPAGERNFIFPLSSNIKKSIDLIEGTLNLSDKKDLPEKREFVEKCEGLFRRASDLLEMTPITLEDLESNYSDVLMKVDEVQMFDRFCAFVTAGNGKISDVNKLVSNFQKEVLAYLRLANGFVEKYDALKALNLLFDEFLEEVNASKRRSGALSFADVSSLALKILEENEDIRNQEKNTYKKIMIDEFQDNNGANRDLLYLLSVKKGEFESEGGKGNFVIKVDEDDPYSLHDQIIIRDSEGKIVEDKRDSDKLFFVGDEKQSIYKFRGADVTVFNGLTDVDSKFSENLLLSMTYNYRSVPELIKSFNILFADGNGIFTAGSGTNSYEAHYTKDAKKKDMNELPELNSENVRMHFCFVSNRQILANDGLPYEQRLNYIPVKDQNAYFAAKKIREIKETTGCSWDKIAILDRSRTNRGTITKYLSLLGIPFAVDQFKNIFEDAVVNDIYNFLRVCVYPSDINSFTSYLTSPFAGLSENDAEIVLSHLVKNTSRASGAEKFVFDPFADFDVQIQADLSKEAFRRFSEARAFFAENRNLVLRQNLTDTLSMLWHKKGYKYETMLSQSGQLCSEHFDMLFELARNTEENKKSLAWFIDELASLKSSFLSEDSDIDAKNVSYPLERESAVQIMTIHKSKGLQFDYVFVLGCTDVSSGSGGGTVFFDEENGVSMKLDGCGGNYFYEKQRGIAVSKELAEFRRLVYVAITRAIKDVFVLGEWKYTSVTAELKEPSENSLKLFERVAMKGYPDFKEIEEGKTVYNKGQAFDYMTVPLVTYDELGFASEKSDDVLRNEVVKKLSDPDIVSVDSEEKPLLVNSSCNPIKKGQPSHMDEVSELKDDGFYKSEKKDSFEELSALIQSYSGSDRLDDTENEIMSEEVRAEKLSSVEFTASDFGTLVHDYLNKLCLGVDIEKFEPQKSMVKNLTDEDRKKVCDICVAMCRKFSETWIYRHYLDAKKSGRFAETELDFKFFDDRILYHGSIDLIFEESDGSFVIADYKTDRKVEPFTHYSQLKCYKKAAKDLVPHEGQFKGFLYYLRFDETVDITRKL